MDADFELDLSLPTAQMAADFTVLVHDLDAKFAALRPVPPQWDDDEDYATTAQLLPLAHGIADVLLAVTAAGVVEEPECRHLADLLQVLVPELQDRDLLADPVKLVRGGYELAREAVLEGYGAVAGLEFDQENDDALIAALAGPRQTVADFHAIREAILPLILGQQALQRLETFVQQQPLLQVTPSRAMPSDQRLALRTLQAQFVGIIRRAREDQGIEAD